jgi:hypothetical protein
MEYSEKHKLDFYFSDIIMEYNYIPKNNTIRTKYGESHRSYNCETENLLLYDIDLINDIIDIIIDIEICNILLIDGYYIYDYLNIYDNYHIINKKDIYKNVNNILNNANYIFINLDFIFDNYNFQL